MARIAFSIDRPGRVALRVYDAAGRVVRTLVDGPKDAREYGAIWDGRDEQGRALPAGVYFYTLRSPGYASTKKMILLR